MSDYALRLAVVLPLLLLVLGGVLIAARRGLIRLPGTVAGLPPLRVVQVVALGTGARLAVVEFEGAQLLVGTAGLALLAPAPNPALEREGDPLAAAAPFPFKARVRGGRVLRADARR